VILRAQSGYAQVNINVSSRAINGLYVSGSFRSDLIVSLFWQKTIVEESIVA
jgi:hypothetical protein